ncbi:MAG TPA: hypothetical protein VFX03_12860, partial [Thermomicrobiales bacterium]|nr:hypothetical protein [Thermomicrobiales bacterium]
MLFQDPFDNLSQWTVSENGGQADIGNQTSQSPSTSLYLRNGRVSVSSSPIDANVSAAKLEVWIRRGDDSFSAEPDDGEDLVVEYRNADGDWIALETFAGGGTPGETFDRSYDLPADALYGNLQIRFEMTGGSGGRTCFLGTFCRGDDDYWHVDDVSITETSPPAPLGLGSCDDFEHGLGNWSGTDEDLYGVSTATADSPTHSLYTRGGAVEVTSNAMDLSGAYAARVSIWIERGGNFQGSDEPGNNDDLVVEYLNSGGSWVELGRFDGGGT